MAKGKYQEWLEPDGLLLIEGWARDGLTDEQIAQNIGIAPKTLYSWIARFNQIGKAIKKGKAPVDFQVENALLKRALGYEWEETTTEIDSNGKKHIKKVTRHQPPDTVAIIFWLKNRRRDRWRDKPDATAAPEDNDLLQALLDLERKHAD